MNRKDIAAASVVTGLLVGAVTILTDDEEPCPRGHCTFSGTADEVDHHVAKDHRTFGELREEFRDLP